MSDARSSRPLNAPADTSARDLGDVPGPNGIALLQGLRQHFHHISH
jgi:hypothetical protein